MITSVSKQHYYIQEVSAHEREVYFSMMQFVHHMCVIVSEVETLSLQGDTILTAPKCCFFIYNKNYT